jgi:hypothetical protein
MIAMPAARLGAVALLLACVSGTGSILVEVMAETGLQRTLPQEIFGRAYGLAIPATIGGIAAGSLAAPALVSGLGLDGALITCGSLALAYGLLLIARRPATDPTVTPVAPTA